MPITIDEALNDEFVTVVHRNDRAGLYHIRIGSLKKTVTIWLKTSRNGWTAFKQSYAIKTPLQDALYLPSNPGNDTPGLALDQAITGLTMYYQQAVEQGYPPNEDWLQPIKR
jgi:hypothetical protein